MLFEQPDGVNDLSGDVRDTQMTHLTFNTQKKFRTFDFYED